jgi:peptidoglycan/xylan/chitin deacetylase (PgdA/CDA1 family)
MRPILLAVAALVLLAGPTADAQAPAAACVAKGALGVSRTIEIDTSKGPRFGHLQYKDQDLLQDGEVVLTFDDGPLRIYTRMILDALDEQCAKATFFMVGRMAVADPEMVREVAKRGHTVGTHTWSHRNLKTQIPSRAAGEIELGLSAVQQALDTPVAPFFRFPYLSDPKGMIDHLAARQMGIFSIDVDSYDYRTRDPATVHRTVMQQLTSRRKGIILFHDIQPSTARALKGLLAEIKQRGFKVVHIVPKSGATTAKEYDVIAQEALAKKKVAAASSALARRSVVWPAGPAEEKLVPQVVPAPLPLAQPQLQVPQAQPVPVVKPAGEEDWRRRAFGH